MTAKTIKNIIGIFFYRWLENLDGEKTEVKLLEYKQAEKIKVFLLNNFIED